MNIVTEIKKLCSPAFVYFVLVSISVIIYLYHMMKDPRINKEYTILGLIINVIFYVFWTWMLNTICSSKRVIRMFGKNSGVYISWGLVILPIFVVGLLMYYIYTASENILLVDILNNEIKNYEENEGNEENEETNEIGEIINQNNFRTHSLEL